MTQVESLLASEGEEMILELKYINFETGSATLTANSRYEVDYAAELMKEYPDLTFELGGHTDDTGDAAMNTELSKARAEAVRAELVAMGVSPERLTAVGYGATRPIADNDTEEGRAQNRRTELKIIAQ
jgi:outer membrane protein OmpA-like peptidoglycan-associated protein